MFRKKEAERTENFVHFLLRLERKIIFTLRVCFLRSFALIEKEKQTELYSINGRFFALSRDFFFTPMQVLDEEKLKVISSLYQTLPLR